jgi:hypothetical protein
MGCSVSFLSHVIARLIEANVQDISGIELVNHRNSPELQGTVILSTYDKLLKVRPKQATESIGGGAVLLESHLMLVQIVYTDDIPTE